MIKRKAKAFVTYVSPLAEFKLLLVWCLLAALVLFFLSGCANLSSSPAQFPKDPSKFYRRDMLSTVNGVEYPGYGVLPITDVYVFEVETKHDMDRFSATNCHKQVVEEKVDGTNWFKKTSKYKFVFQRLTPIEKADPCVLELVASSEGNDHTWGFFDFQDTTYLLPAYIECDGWQAEYPGVSVCQAKAGLTESITFSEPVIQDDTSPLPTKDNKRFEFEIAKGRQVHVFCSHEKQCHRFTTLGYDEAWLREQK